MSPFRHTPAMPGTLSDSSADETDAHSLSPSALSPHPANKTSQHSYPPGVLPHTTNETSGHSRSRSVPLTQPVSGTSKHTYPPSAFPANMTSRNLRPSSTLPTIQLADGISGHSRPPSPLHLHLSHSLVGRQEHSQTVRGSDASLFADDSDPTTYASAVEDSESPSPSGTPRPSIQQVPGRSSSVPVKLSVHNLKAADQSTPSLVGKKRVAAIGEGKCRYREVDWSESLRADLHEREQTVSHLRQQLREHEQIHLHDEKRYEVLRNHALVDAQREFTKKSAHLQSTVQLQAVEINALRARLEDQANSHLSAEQRFRQAQEAVELKHRAETENIRAQFEDHIRQRMDEMLNLSNMNLANALQRKDQEIEARFREELEKASTRMEADKERELANLEQRNARCRTQPPSVDARVDAHTDPDREVVVSMNPPTEADLRPPPNPRHATSSSSNRTTRQLFPTPITPSLDAIKRIKRHRGISRTTQLIGVRMDASQYPASVPEDKQPEEHNSSKRAGDVSSVAAQIGKVVEELVRDTLGDKVGVDNPARHSPRRRRVENMEVKLQKENEPTQHRDFILGEVRRLFKDMFNITQDIDFVSHQPVPIPDVQAFKSEDGPGPNVNQLAFDLSKNYSSLWNAEALEILLRMLQQRSEDEGWPIKRPDNYIREVLRHRYKRLRTTWLRAQPKLTRDGIPETPMEVEVRMLQYMAKHGKESRQTTRRHNKYQRRVAVLDHIIALKMETGDNDLTAWEWLQRLVKMLGEHGMSSEESAGENEVEPVLYVKRLEWRRCIDRKLDIIDAQRMLDSDIFSPRGAKPVKRIRAPGNPVGSRDAVQGLPVDFYDAAWFGDLTQRQTESLNLSKDNFVWMQIMTMQ